MENNSIFPEIKMDQAFKDGSDPILYRAKLKEPNRDMLTLFQYQSSDEPEVLVRLFEKAILTLRNYRKKNSHKKMPIFCMILIHHDAATCTSLEAVRQVFEASEVIPQEVRSYLEFFHLVWKGAAEFEKWMNDTARLRGFFK